MYKSWIQLTLCFSKAKSLLVNKVNKSSNLPLPFLTLHKIWYLHLISWCGNFMEMHGFHIVSGESPKTTQKLCLSIKFPHQEIRWKYGILRSITLSETVIYIIQEIKFWSTSILLKAWKSSSVLAIVRSIT